MCSDAQIDSKLFTKSETLFLRILNVMQEWLNLSSEPQTIKHINTYLMFTTYGTWLDCQYNVVVRRVREDKWERNPHGRAKGKDEHNL